MEKTKWWLLGDVNVPEDKRDELNGFIIQLFDKGGIRKTEEITLAGRTITTVKKVQPDEKGLLKFDYSIFEQIKRDECTYDMKTGKLDLNAHGGNEFGLVMNMLMFLLESYTDGNCYVMEDDHPVEYVSGYMELLENMLGKKFYLNNRGRLCNIMLFFRNHPKVKYLEPVEIVRAFPWNNGDLDLVQLDAILAVNSQKPHLPDDETSITRQSEIAGASRQQRYDLCCTVMQRALEQNEEETVAFLRELLNACLSERQLLAGREDDLGILAELSLYMLPPKVVGAYVFVKKMEFWDAWDFFDVEGYTDVLDNEKASKEKIKDKSELLSFYRIIQREDEDEFLEFYGDHELLLSDELKDRIEYWKQEIHTAQAIDPGEVENYLADILTDLEGDWKCRYADKEFVEEMLCNKDNEYYRRALVLLRGIMDEDLKYFPELTARQATDWMIKGNRDNHDCIAMMAFQSMLMNKGLRKDVLGF